MDKKKLLEVELYNVEQNKNALDGAIKALETYKSDISKRLETYLVKNGVEAYYVNESYGKYLYLYYEKKEADWRYNDGGEKEETIRTSREHEQISVSTGMRGYNLEDKPIAEIIENLRSISEYRGESIKRIKSDLANFDNLVARVEELQKIIEQSQNEIKGMEYHTRKALGITN